MPTVSLSWRNKMNSNLPLRKINHIEILILREVQIKCIGSSSSKKVFAVGGIGDDERGLV